jgi:RNA polymerase primary sigma factor
MPQTSFARRDPGTDSEELFLAEAKKYPPLSRDEQFELGRRVQEHDDDLAAKRQVNHCLLLAYSVAREVSRRRKCPDRLMELLSVGLEILTRGARTFDPEKGVPFANYIARSMDLKMRSYLSEHARATRMPKDAARQLARLRRFAVQHQEEHGGFPSVAALAEHEGMSEARAAEFVPHLQDELSLDATTAQGREQKGGDLLIQLAADVEPADARAESASLASVVARTLEDILDARELVAVRAFFGIGYARTYELDEIGEMIGVGGERARQIKNGALRKLRGVAAARELWLDIAA